MTGFYARPALAQACNQWRKSRKTNNIWRLEPAFSSQLGLLTPDMLRS